MFFLQSDSSQTLMNVTLCVIMMSHDEIAPYCEAGLTVQIFQPQRLTLKAAIVAFIDEETTVKSAEAISRFLAGKSEKKWAGNKSMSYKLVSRRGSLAVCSLLSCRQMEIICLINVHDFSSKWSRNNDYVLVSFFNQDQLVIDYRASCNTLDIKYVDWLCGTGINSRNEPIILTPCNVLVPREQY